MGSQAKLVLHSWRYALGRSLPRGVWRWLLATACALPVLALLHQLGLALAALALGWLFGPTGTAQGLVAGRGDAIYSRLVLSMVDNARPSGLALGPPLPDLGWAALAFPAGSSSVGIHLLELVVNLGMVSIGAALLVLSRARPRRRLFRRISAAGLALPAGLCLAYGAGAEMRLPWSAGSGGEIALSMVATKILGIDSQVYGSALQHGHVLSLAVDFVLVVVVAAAGAAASYGLLEACSWGHVRWRRLALARRRLGTLPLLAVLAGVTVVIGPMQSRVVFQRQPRLAAAALPAPQASVPAAEQPTSAADAQPAPEPAQPPPVPDDGPSVVRIVDGVGGFDLLVNGQPTYVRGIGYNAQTAGLTGEQRAARYDRDFGEIRAMGANVITGWDQNQFDDLLLEKAAQHGLGVILPFDLKPAWAYDDPRVRLRLIEDISTWVERYKDSPGLRMWGLGNEVLHATVPAKGRRPQAFAEFLVQAADVVHTLDPDHPVIYRDAEDVFLPPVAAALKANPAPRPWFVYGMNFFTTRIDAALSKGPAVALHQPLLISEFGPVGLRPADRPLAYQKLWAMIAAHRGVDIGGCVYVWTTAGPEPLDRGFGLTNEAGVPVDGTVAALGALFQADQQAEAGSRT